MKEERMAILNMLEKGIITVDEADRLLTTLHSGMGLEKEGIGKAVGSALEKASAALSSVAGKVKENPTVKSAAEKVTDKADELQPKMRSAAFRMSEKISEKADELQPAVRSAAFRMSEKASGLKDDMAAYRDKLKERKSRNEAEDWSDLDLEEMDAEEITSADIAADAKDVSTAVAGTMSKIMEALGLPEEEAAEPAAETTLEEALEEAASVMESALDELPAAEEIPAEEMSEEEMISPEMNKYLNKVEDVLDGMNDQMEQLNDMENFLKATFGDFDPSEWEDDEEEAEEEKKED